MIGNGLEQDRTLSFSRQDLLTKSQGALLRGLNESQQAIMLFSRKLAEDPNITGVAVSRIKYGGIYTHFFVKELGSEEVIIRTLYIIRNAFTLLGSGSPDRVGYSSFIFLGSRTFDDEVEEAFRKRWNAGDPNDPFNPRPFAEELDLLQIVKFV